MRISLIAAVAENRVIGKDNDLVWRLPDDMNYFMRVTENHHVIMGRRNWDSIPEKYRPLKNRTNIVLTKNKKYGLRAIDTFVFTDLNAAIEFARSRGENELFIIGGSQIYEQALSQTTRMYLTEVHGSPEGDTFFPFYDKDDWVMVSRIPHPSDQKHRYSFDFVIYDRIIAR